jgi:glycosyltransferase involved in cell wall biosynthesis
MTSVHSLPSISILIPTLNAARVLPACLASIRAQDYPPELVEVIVADGGSQDDTLDIARQHTEIVLANPLKTGEAGKAVALKQARNEIVGLIDSDNILPHSSWLREMVAPFADATIVAAEPLEYTWRPEDGFITRYCALMGMNDPLCLFLGNYDRLSYLTQKWTEVPVEVEDRGSYLRVRLPTDRVPTMGANGFLIRRQALADCRISDYFFDIDVAYALARQGCAFAKVKTGIVHLFSDDVGSFARKQRRRIKDFTYYRASGLRQYPWSSLPRLRLAKFAAYTVTTVPLFVQALKGYRRLPDHAWWFHLLACWITLWVYGTETVRGVMGMNPQSRGKWGQ